VLKPLCRAVLCCAVLACIPRRAVPCCAGLQEATRLLEDPSQQYSAARAITLTDGSELAPLHIAYAQHNYAAVQLLVSQGGCAWTGVACCLRWLRWQGK
jgi:hypothetical protein